MEKKEKTEQKSLEVPISSAQTKALILQAATAPIASAGLTPEQIAKTKNYSVADGASYNMMVGFGEQYIIPFAIKLGASNQQIAMLSSVPTFLGSISQVIGAWLSERFQSRKSMIASFAFIQALLLVPLFIVPFLTQSVAVLTIIFSIYMVLSNMCAPAWNSMMGDLVLDDERASYFARRNRSAFLALFFSILCAGIILQFFENINVWVGFGILFSIAFFGRMLSWVFLMKHHDPPRILRAESHLPFNEFIKKMKSTAFGNFTIFRVSIALSAMIAVPFFSVYMLKNLGFSYIQYGAVLLVPMMVRALTATYWGAYSSRFGNRSIMYASVILVAAIPLVWSVAGFFFEDNPLVIFLLILFAEVMSGFAWGGFELTTFNYMLDASESKDRARLFAYFNVIFGSAVLIGGMLGSLLVVHLSAIEGGISAILAVFFISFILRTISILCFLPKVPDVKNHPHIDDRKLALEVLVTKPLGFAIHSTLSTLTFIEHTVIRVGKESSRVLRGDLFKKK